MSVGTKAAMERAHAFICQAIAGIPVRSLPQAMGRLNQIARMIVETGEVFAVDGDIMQVLRSIPSRTGPRHDVVLVRVYRTPTWTPAPFKQAVQFRTLERLVADGAVTFPMGLSRKAQDFIRDWSPAEIDALHDLVERPLS